MREHAELGEQIVERIPGAAPTRARDPPPPRAFRRPRVPRRPGRLRDPDRGAHRRRRRHVLGDHAGAPPTRPRAAARRRSRSCAAARARSSTRRSSPRLQAVLASADADALPPRGLSRPARRGGVWHASCGSDAGPTHRERRCAENAGDEHARFPSRERVREALAAAGLEVEIVETPGVCAHGGRGGGCRRERASTQIVKSLVFLCDGRPVLALVAGDNRLDESLLGQGSRAATSRARTPPRACASTRASRSAAWPRSARSTPCPTFCDVDLLAHEPRVGRSRVRPTPSSASSRPALAAAAGAKVAELALREPAS